MAGSDPLPTLLLVGGDGHPSGVPRHIRHLCVALRDHAQITVASDEDHGGYTALEGADHITIPGLQSRLRLSSLWQGWRGLKALLGKNRADIVWLHARLPVVFGRVLLALRLFRPQPQQRVVVTYHGLPFGPGHRAGFAGISKRMERGLLRLCPPLDLVFLTATQAERMTQTIGDRVMARHRMHVLANSSDLGALPEVSHSGPPHLVMTGRCGWQKNTSLALRFFAHLPQDYTLTLCGAGTQSEAFQAEASEILTPEALSRVRFAGPLPDVRPVLASADGYLLCSRYEGLPIGALEAFEAGLPLILSRFDGAEDLTKAHPMALTLGFEDLQGDAQQVTQMIQTYRETRPEAAPRIKSAWAQHWSFEAFVPHAQALLDVLTQRR